MRWGRRLEAAIADEFADEHPEFRLVKPKVMYRHAEIPYMMSNPDRLIFEPKTATGEPYPLDSRGDILATGPPFEWDSFANPSTGLECKCSNIAEDWDGDYPPDRVLVQVQHQICVHDFPGMWVALLEQGRYYREWWVPRDQAAIDVLVAEEAAFWQLVESGTPPAVDGNAATSDAVKQMYEVVEPGLSVELGDEGLALFEERRQIKAAAKALAEESERVDNALRLAFGHADTVTVNGETAATYNTVNARRVDNKALAEDHPQLVETYRKPSSYRRLNVAKGFK
jgi:predicted phage-related endonuclease